MWACLYENSDLPNIIDNLTAPSCNLVDFEGCHCGFMHCFFQSIYLLHFNVLNVELPV